MRNHRLARRVLGALVVVACCGLAYALALQLVLDHGLALRGIWTWNSGSASVVKVRLQSVGPACPWNNHQPTPATPYVRSVKIVLKARAIDGTTVQGGAIGQIPAGATREFAIALPKPVTQLQLLQATWLGGGPAK